MGKVELYPCPVCATQISRTSIKCPACGDIHAPEDVDPVLSWGMGTILGGGLICMYALVITLVLGIIWAGINALF